jgi:putative membrane protein
MKFFRQIKGEVKRTTDSTYLKIALIAVTIIPLFYGALYLKAFWDPYAKIDQVPVAVVNLDKGYIDNDTNVNLGNNLVTNLKSDNNLKWCFVNINDANKGLNQKKYYASLTIPADFSDNVYSVDGNNPTSASLIYKSREATNYLATTITNQVANQVTDSLSHQMIKKYFNNIFVNLKNTTTNIVQAKDASIQLADGLTSVSNGTNNLQLGINNANIGSGQLVNGLNILISNQNKLTTGIISATSAVDQLEDGAKQVSNGLSQTNIGLTNASNGLSKIQTGLDQSRAGLTQASAIINNYISTNPSSATSLGLASGILDNINGANSGLSQVSTGVSQLSNGVNNLTLGNNELIAGQNQVVSGLFTVKSGLIVAESGSSNLANGSNQLLSGATALNNGLLAISSGTNSLSSNLNSIKNGTIKLSNSLSNGADNAIAETNDKKITTETAIMASPVTLTNKSYDIVANYGSGFAPYFISLALWVGGLLSFFVIDFTKKPQTKTIAMIKYLILSVVGIVQAIALDLVLKNILSLLVTNPWQFYGFTILISLTFMAILQLLIQHMDNAGRYIAIVLLILQLASAAGTFPKETLPMFFQIVNPFLPMTYSVLGIKDILFTHELSNLWGPIIYFTATLVACLVLNLLLTKTDHSVKLIKKVL